jgi:signal peptidase I
VILTGGAVVGVLCILVAVGAAVAGLRPLVFRSGSMSPSIETGALAISHRTDASALHRGDVVSVTMKSGDRVTHRILALDRDGTYAVLTLKGDANDTADLEAYRVATADRVLFSVPRLGYLIGWLTGPLGLFLLGLYAAFLLSVIFRRPDEPPREGPDGGTDEVPPSGVEPPTARGRRAGTHTRRGSTDRVAPTRRLVVPAVALTFLAGVFAQVWALPTLAAWSDAGGVSGTTLTAYRVPAPVIASCDPTSPGLSGTTRHVTYTWPGVTSPATTYNVAVANITTTGITVAGTTTKTVDIAYDTSNAAGNRQKTATVTITPAVAGPWSGPTGKGKFLTSNNTNAATCGEVDPPDVSFVAPDATSRTVANEKTFITSACTTNTVIACGTYADASTVTITYTLRRVVSGVTRCWTGSWSNTAVSGACTAFQAAAVSVASGVKVWSEAATQNTVYAAAGGAGAYTLTVKATDSWQNVTTVVQDFTLT